MKVAFLLFQYGMKWIVITRMLTGDGRTLVHLPRSRLPSRISKCDFLNPPESTIPDHWKFRGPAFFSAVDGGPVRAAAFPGLPKLQSIDPTPAAPSHPCSRDVVVHLDGTSSIRTWSLSVTRKRRDCLQVCSFHSDHRRLNRNQTDKSKSHPWTWEGTANQTWWARLVRKRRVGPLFKQLLLAV